MSDQKRPCPSDWNVISVAECCDNLDHRRVPVNSEERAQRRGDVPYYGANGQQGWIDKYLFDEDLILLAEDGGDFDNYATKSIAYRISGKSWVNNHAHVIRAKPGFSQSFIFYSLVHKDIRHFIRATTRSKLNKGELNKVEICIPYLEAEQRAIAAILDTMDEAIRRTEALIAKLQKIKAGLLHNLITRGLDEHGQLRDPLRHPEQFKDSELGRIPKAWDVNRVEKVGEVFGGRQLSPAFKRGSDPTPYLRVANVYDGYIDYSDVLAMDFSEAQREVYYLRHGDILLNEGQSLELVGRSSIFRGPERTYCFQNTLLRFRCSTALHYEFAWMVFKRWLDTGAFARVARQTTSVAHLGGDRFCSMLLPVPPRNEQVRICCQFNALVQKIHSEQVVLEKLKAVKQGLMQDLLTGRVRMSSDGMIECQKCEHPGGAYGAERAVPPESLRQRDPLQA